MQRGPTKDGAIARKGARGILKRFGETLKDPKRERKL